MKIGRLLELLREYEVGDRLGFAGRPDDSGIRYKGVNRKPDRRLPDFPYDRDVFYGQPTAYDRGSSATGPLEKPLTPKYDSKFSLTILGLENPIDDVEEALGTPSLLSKGDTSNIGSSIPGMGGGWAVNPPRKWHRSEMDDSPSATFDTSSDDTEMFEGNVFDTRPPGIDSGPGSEAPTFRAHSDDDLDIDGIWDREPQELDPSISQPEEPMLSLAPDPWRTVNNRLNTRGSYGAGIHDSVWHRVDLIVSSKTEVF